MFQKQHLLIICTVWPESASSAAGSRMMQLIQLFLSSGCRISLACDAQETPYSDDLAAYDLQKITIELNNSSFDEAIRQLEPTLVLFDRYMTEEKYGWRVSEQCPEALKILDTEDLHFLRKGRQEALKKQSSFDRSFLFNDIAKREIASIYRCDLSLIISTYEMEVLQSVLKIDPSILHYMPFLLDPITEEEVSTWPTYIERSNFVSIGNFLHDPNTDAVLFLQENIWPLIRKQLPETEVHIYGAYLPEKINRLNNPSQGFIVQGRAPDSGEIIKKAKVLLAPLRFGAGIKGKLTEAMQCGTPSVTTTIGAEGMHGIYDWNGFISNDPEEIAARAVYLYTTEQIWTLAQNNGIKIINDFYSKQAHSSNFIDRVIFLQNNLGNHRASNFIGSMLQHHSLASTKYMSKWIELKNKP